MISESPRSQVTEQEIIDTITNHASRIAESVLSQSDTGMVLEDDIRVKFWKIPVPFCLLIMI